MSHVSATEGQPIERGNPDLTAGGLKSPFNVLFLESEPITAQVRIRPLLDRLRSNAQISGYAVVDRNMGISGDLAGQYDLVIAHRNLSTRQGAWLRRSSARFLFDIDDLLLERKEVERDRRRTLEGRSIAWCLANAQLVTAPSRRLLRSLEDRLHTSFGGRGAFLPNAGAQVAPPPKTASRPRLLWVSSAAMPAPPLLEVCSGIDAAARVLGTDILLVGRFDPQIVARFGRAEHISWMPRQQYVAMLSEGPFIAVVPLPVGLHTDEQAFFDCKSDVKAAEYGSNRIAGIYSPVPPYTETELPCCVAADNSADTWKRGILQMAREFPALGNSLAEHPAFAERRPEILARRFLMLLFRIHDLPGQPVRFRAVATPPLFRNLERGVRKLRAKLRVRCPRWLQR